MKVELIKCDLCCFEHATYDFFKKIVQTIILLNMNLGMTETKQVN